MKRAAAKKAAPATEGQGSGTDAVKGLGKAMLKAAETSKAATKDYTIPKAKVKLVIKRLFGATKNANTSLPVEDIVKNPHTLKRTAEKYGVSEASIEDMYERIRKLEENSRKPSLSQNDMAMLHNQIESMRTMPDFGRLGDIEEVRQSLASIENKIGNAPESSDKLQDAEIERDSLIKSKEELEKKYYKREVDADTFKKIMQEYEQKLIQTEEKIKSYKQSAPGAPRFDMGRVFGRYARGYKNVFYPQQPMMMTQQQWMMQQQQPQQFSQAQPVLQQRVVEAQTIVPKRVVDGITIPQTEPKPFDAAEDENENMMKINAIYPLIPRKPAKGEIVYAYTNIKWEQQENALVYNVFEPVLTAEEKRILARSKDILEERLNIDLRKLRKAEAVSYLMRQTDDVFSVMGVKLGPKRIDVLKYYIKRDFAGLERIEPLMNDPNIEDISCDGTNIPLFIFHKNPMIGSIRTNIKFQDQKSLDTFAIKLSQRAGKNISMAEPLLDGTLADGSRVQATLGTDIAMRGSNFTIRKFTDVPLTPIDLMNYGTVNATSLAYLWIAVENGKSVLIGGSTASGKTTMLNVLSLFIKPTKKIVSIEDTPELRLPHPHWVPEVARTAISDNEGKKIGEVDMFDLLKESLRQRPDYIIVGEVRGKEAYVLFQQIASGHPGMSTIHADSISKLVDRLTTPPINLPGSLIQNLDILVFTDTTSFKNKNVRKVDTIMEITGYENSAPTGNTVFKWDPAKKYLKAVGSSTVLKKIAYSSNVSESAMQEEVKNRVKVLEWMQERGISDFASVTKVFGMYNADPERVLGMVE